MPEILRGVMHLHHGKPFVLVACCSICSGKHVGEEGGLHGQEALVDVECDSAGDKDEVPILHPKLLVMRRNICATTSHMTLAKDVVVGAGSSNYV